MADSASAPGHRGDAPALGVKDARTSVRRDELLAKRRGDGGGGRVAVDVVRLAPLPRPDGGDDRGRSRRPRGSAAPPAALPSRLPQAQVERLAGLPLSRCSSSRGAALRPCRRARPPSAEAVISATIRWLTVPPRTISTTSIALRGGHPQPSARRVGSKPSRESVDLGPAAVDRSRAGSRHTGAGRCPARTTPSARRPSSRRPPYFTTTVFPVNSRMYGSASISVSAFRIFTLPSLPHAPQRMYRLRSASLHDPASRLLRP